MEKVMSKKWVRMGKEGRIEWRKWFPVFVVTKNLRSSLRREQFNCWRRRRRWRMGRMEKGNHTKKTADVRTRRWKRGRKWEEVSTFFFFHHRSHPLLFHCETGKTKKVHDSYQLASFRSPGCKLKGIVINRSRCRRSIQVRNERLSCVVYLVFGSKRVRISGWDVVDQ